MCEIFRFCCFLRFVRKPQAEKHPEGKRKEEHASWLKTIVNPSKEAIQRHTATIEQKLRHLQTASQAQVIKDLNPLIVGWTSYYNGVVEATGMNQYDEFMEQQLIHWASMRHPGKARDWLLTRYWHPSGEHRRVFATHDGIQLRTYRQTSILKNFTVE